MLQTYYQYANDELDFLVQQEIKKNFSRSHGKGQETQEIVPPKEKDESECPQDKVYLHMLRLTSVRDKQYLQDLINIKREIQYNQEELKYKDKYSERE